MATSNIDIVKDYLAAAQRQDIPAMQSAFADDLTYRVPGRGPLSGVTTGRDAAIDYFGAIMKLTGGTYKIEGVIDWLASETRVAMVVRESASRDGRNVRWNRVVLFTFRGDKIAEVALFDDDLYALDAVLAG